MTNHLCFFENSHSGQEVFTFNELLTLFPPTQLKPKSNQKLNYLKQNCAEHKVTAKTRTGYEVKGLFFEDEPNSGYWISFICAETEETGSQTLYKILWEDLIEEIFTEQAKNITIDFSFWETF